jgi:hypothetical protein
VNLFQSAFTKRCPMMVILRKGGLPDGRYPRTAGERAIGDRVTAAISNLPMSGLAQDQVGPLLVSDPTAFAKVPFGDRPSSLLAGLYRPGESCAPGDRIHLLFFGLIKAGAEVLSHGLAHPRRCSCPLVGAAGVDLAAPRCAHVSGAAAPPVGGDGQLWGTRRGGATAVAPSQGGPR